ncbi:glucan endo-1,3-beta-glucosidase 5 [Selaginella moellendorffii]|nr:glucan endo-1,3-beta-glucosidase 5 [Selaginella moellendorffii]|eukprot:XP_002985426.2 glucan endo-1,3-beta-glucosidase 5 [Selaginella moellendorffii]
MSRLMLALLLLLLLSCDGHSFVSTVAQTDDYEPLPPPPPQDQQALPPPPPSQGQDQEPPPPPPQDQQQPLPPPPQGQEQQPPSPADQRHQSGTIGVNWGTQMSHPLFAPDVVRALVSNNVGRVKLFEAEPRIMSALAGSPLEVMLGIPNDMLETLATDAAAASNWVLMNVTHYYLRKKRVNIRYVAVGNEPFLAGYNKSFEGVTLPALKNIQAALSKAKFADQIKATVPLNADVLQPRDPGNQDPSTGVFRNDIKMLMDDIVKALASTGAPFTINLYPFISLAQDPNFPSEYAFLDGCFQVQYGQSTYRSVFDATFDMLVAALTDSGFPNMEIIVGEAGWPTDGFPSATPSNARRFNQALVSRIISPSPPGTPMRPGTVLHAYIFSLFDEDLKSIAPGNFERHWGLFTYDGQPKYLLNTSGSSSGLEKVGGVDYYPALWCVLKPGIAVPQGQIDFACSAADCTPLVPDGGSCYPTLSPEQAASYAFNSYFQLKDQVPSSCDFQGNGIITGVDPSTPNCRFIRQIKLKVVASHSSRVTLERPRAFAMMVFAIVLAVVIREI